MKNDKDINMSSDELDLYNESIDSDIPIVSGNKLNLDEAGAFMITDYEAREAAGLLDKDGVYYFDCPCCGNRCRGERKAPNRPGGEKGSSRCLYCKIVFGYSV